MPSFTRLALAALPLVASISAQGPVPVYNSAWGNAIIKNSCDQEIYFWEDKGDYGPQMQTVAPGGQHKGPLFQTGKANGAGPSIKLALTNLNGQLPSSITQFEYTVAAPNSGSGLTSETWFDISNVDSDGKPPFAKGGVQVTSPQDPKCAKTCPPDVTLCLAGYNNPTDDKQAMTNTFMGNDIEVHLCYGSGSADVGSDSGSGSGGAPSSSPPASSPAASPSASAPPAPEEKIKVAPSPSPSPTPSPSPVEAASVNAQGSTVVVVETVTVDAPVVTVHVQGRSEKEKREEHLHNHAHAHQKINKRRHGA